jgi:hypothetical protein
MNGATERIIDGSSSEMTGKPIWGQFPASISTEVEQKLRDVMQRRTAESSENFDEQRYRWFLVSMYPFRDGVSVISRDISNKKRAELQREQLINELRDVLGQVRTLRGLIPICAWCKKIRNDLGYWQQLEGYISDHSEADFSHGICPECVEQQSK